jgi:xylulokinase
VKYFLGFDIGSSSVKTALLDAESGKPLAAAFSPETEMAIQAPAPGFAEQDPERWWQELVAAVNALRRKHAFSREEIGAIGISYQMHGLVCIGKDHKPLRPAIIWCDSRAVAYGNQAFDGLGHAFCLGHFLNSPGNFTASKLKWVKENEPDIYKKIFRVLLPGDFIALKLTGEAVTTVSGLSEGIFWDYREHRIADSLMNFYGLDAGLLAPTVPTFGIQGRLQREAASLLGIAEGTPVAYRAGDQPNNAFSLNVLEPGEIAATAGTSGVVYGITDQASYDPQSRVNPFVHVNHLPDKPRYGILMCLNGTGILNSWLRKNFFGSAAYGEINAEAEQAAPGADGIFCYPFGNGAERILENKTLGASIRGIDFNRHSRSQIARAAQEGIVFALIYGTEIMRPMGLHLSHVRAGFANMFLSPLFAQTFANLSGCRVELYNTDGALGAARGAGSGVQYYTDLKACFRGMEIVKQLDPQVKEAEQIREVYEKWKAGLNQFIK